MAADIGSVARERERALGVSPSISVEDLERLLTKSIGSQVEIVRWRDLGASSRATPFKVDVSRGGVSESFLLRYGESVDESEAVALQAMADHAIPTPALIAWEPENPQFGGPVFVSEFIEGSSLLQPMTAREPWAIDLYTDTVISLQAIQREDLPPESGSVLADRRETALDVVDAALQRFENPQPLHEAAYSQLIRQQPRLPALTFSNGDLWPDNLLAQDGKLVGVIDWQHAGWSDPIFEFLLPFFLVADLRGHGIEEAYLRRQGYDASLLHWYHGVEFFDSLAWVTKTGEPYGVHTVESLTEDLTTWLNSS